MDKKINGTLCTFIGEGPIWDALNTLQDTKGSRFGAYCALIELTQAGDVDELDKICDTGAAMYLAAQLVGMEMFQATIATSILSAIKLDTEDGDLSERDAKMLMRTLSVSIS